MMLSDKVRLFYICTLGLLSGPASVLAVEAYQPQQSGHVISILDDAGPVMDFTASELKYYLERMTDRDWTVTKEDVVSADCVIRLRLADDLPTDSYRVQREYNWIEIRGGEATGCLYGAYAWLHSLGCRWSLPGDEYEIVPKSNPEHWNDSVLSAYPVLPRRGMVVCIENPNDQSILETIDYLAKNGFNYLFLHIGSIAPELQDELAEALNQRGMGFEYGGHHLAELLPRELFDEHPEYFRMEDGQRVQHLNMCPSSEGAADVIAENAKREYLDSYLKTKIDTLETLHLWPDDLFGGGWCSCPKCKDLSESDQSLLILNKVAERLDEALEETMLGHCAYHASIIPPKTVTAHPKVRLMYAPRERSYRVPLNGCKGNQWYLQQLHGLIKAAPNQPEVFEYYHDLILFRFLPMPLHPIIGDDVEVYQRAGITGVASLSFKGYDTFAYGMNTYVLGRSMWRGHTHQPDGAQGYLRDYCRDVYGPAGDAMVEYYTMLHELCATAMDTCMYTGFVDLRQLPPYQEGLKQHAEQLSPLVKPEHLDRIESKLESAMQIDADPYQERVRRQWPLWQFARQEVLTIHLGIVATPKIHTAMEEGSTAEQRAEAIQLIDRIMAGIDKGTEILDGIPVEDKGPYGVVGNGAYEERKSAYKVYIKQYRERLQKRSDGNGE